MASQDYQSLFLPEKKLDAQARQFIRSAYNVGMSIKLINRFLQESNYDCTMPVVENKLRFSNIFPDNYNCSRASGIGKRYLTYIVDKFNCNTLEEFSEIALNEAKMFYDYDDNAFINYWHELFKFRNQLIRDEGGNNVYKLANNEWVMHALLHFGYTLTALSNYLTANNNNLRPNLVLTLYKEELKRIDRNYVFPGSLHPSTDIPTKVKNFWISCRQIGKEFHTIIEWTKIFLGQECTEEDIRAHTN